jgi:SAM-dependent methyltransferase
VSGERVTGAEWSASFAAASRAAMQVYDEVMVPRMFEPWGGLLLDELALAEGEAVLDVACGPGSVTRLAAARVGAAGRVTGADLSPAMLAIAREKPRPAGSAPIEYVQAPAEQLPVADASIDVAVCQQGLQFFPDRVGALAEMRRALRPGGRVGVAVWASIEECPPYATLAAAVRDVAGAELAARLRDGPWGLPEARVLDELLEQAGFKDVWVAHRALPVTFEGGPEQLASVLGAAAIAADLAALPAEDQERLAHAIAEHARPLMRGAAVVSRMASHLAFARR